MQRRTRTEPENFFSRQSIVRAKELPHKKSVTVLLLLSLCFFASLRILYMVNVEPYISTQPNYHLCHSYMERNLIVLKFGYQITFNKSNSTTTKLFELRQTQTLTQKSLSLALPAIYCCIITHLIVVLDKSKRFCEFCSLEYWLDLTDSLNVEMFLLK